MQLQQTSNGELETQYRFIDLIYKLLMQLRLIMIYLGRVLIRKKLCFDPSLINFKTIQLSYAMKKFTFTYIYIYIAVNAQVVLTSKQFSFRN